MAMSIWSQMQNPLETMHHGMFYTTAIDQLLRWLANELVS